MATPMRYADFQKLVQPPAPGPILAYGADPLQHVELWRPAGKGPFPVVLMLHGGCWQTGVAKADIMHMLAADLVKRGIAVWNVEYRGVDVPGGGYPGTFQDVAAAADLLGREGPKLGLDTRRVVAVGHSAGGHLALWLAGRPKIARTSVLWSAHPLPIAGVLSQGGLPDLPLAKSDAAEACGADTVDRAGRPADQGASRSLCRYVGGSAAAQRRRSRRWSAAPPTRSRRPASPAHWLAKAGAPATGCVGGRARSGAFRADHARHAGLDAGDRG